MGRTEPSRITTHNQLQEMCTEGGGHASQTLAFPVSQLQGCAAAKPLAALAGKVRLAVAGKFPIIPKGYSGLVQQLLVVPSHWWNYGELWGIMVEIWGIWGIMRKPQESTTSHQESAATPQESKGTHQESTASHQESTASHQESRTN